MKGRAAAVALAVALLAALWPAACGTARYGRMPDTRALASLRQRVSTPDDVRQALGEPRGFGRADLGGASPPQDLWYYDAFEASGERMVLRMLVVFLEGERYTGHLWFAYTGDWETSLAPAGQRQ